MNLKKLFSFSVIFLTLSVAFAGSQNSDKEKKITKSYSVSSNDKLNIENEYGQVTVDTWDKNEVSVEITVKSSAKSDDKAQEILESVSISDTKAGGAIYLKTIIRSNVVRTGRQSLSIDYKVFMPSNLYLNVYNKFGNVNLPALTSHLQVKVSYGNLRALRLTGSQEKRIEVAFGSADIDELDNGFVESKYSKLNIDKVGTAEIKNSFGKTNIQTAGTLRIAQKYGDLEVRRVNVISGNVEFSNLDFDYLGKSADITLKYSGNADFGVISSSVDLLKVNAGFSSVYMKFDESANQSFEANLKFGDIKLNNHLLKDYVKNADQHTNTSEYKGKIGKGGGGTILITSNYTTIYFQ